MRALLQRAAAASVSIDGEPTASIGSGLVVLLGIARDDDEADAEYLVGKTVNLRIFSDESGHFNRSALDAGAELLVVSQFTLYAATRKGRDGQTSPRPRRPSRRNRYMNGRLSSFEKRACGWLPAVSGR